MPDSQTVREALDRIVASTGFANSPRMSRFLRFVVEETVAGRANDLKEYVVGVRVFDKAESFDPSSDTTVRVEASKLRGKLARYYETDGQADPIRIEIPKGHYAAQLHHTRSASSISGVSRLLPWFVVSAIMCGVAGFVGWSLGPGPTSARDATRSVLALHPFGQPRATRENTNSQIVRPWHTAVAFSPDGRTLAIQAIGTNGGSQLYLRPLNRLESTPIAGTQGGRNPFFSPDGAWLGFWAGGELKKVPIAGGPASTIGAVPGPPPGQIHGASWGTSDIIIFGTPDATGGRLWQVSALGGEPRALTNRAAGEFAHRLPHVLPGGTAVLFTISRTAFRWDDAQIAVRSLTTGKQTVLLEDAADARYVSSGHLVFVRRGTLMAAPFDLSRLELTGAPVSVVEKVMQSVNQVSTAVDSGAAQFAVSELGTLVYATGGINPDERRTLVWVNRNGTSQPLPVPPATYFGPQLDPTGKRLAVFTTPSGNSRVWTLDPRVGALTALTTVEERGHHNVWAPNGRKIAFSSLAQRAIFMKNADGSGIAQRVAQSDYFVESSAWTPDSTVLAFVEHHPLTSTDIWEVDVNGSERQPRAIVQTLYQDTHPAFSPNGRWLAYASNDSGRLEVYVQPYPGPGRRMRMSTDGGTSPAWRRDGKELYYLEVHPPGSMGIVAVRVDTDADDLFTGVPRRLFHGRYGAMSGRPNYDVTSDGQRFLMVQALDPLPEPATELILVNNWFQELRQLAPSR
jgi:serine/threonine-protein kinase